MEEEKYTTAPMDTEVEVSLDEADQYEEAQKEKPKVDLTEEETKVAVERVSQLIDLLDEHISKKETNINKFYKLKEKYDALPETSYKRKQLAIKMLNLAYKINPRKTKQKNILNKK